jgi:hypothetical protein
VRYTYHVFHDEARKSRLDAALAPFTEDQAEHEYFHFPTTLRLHYSAKTIRASSTPAENGVGVFVTLNTEGDERAADDSLADLLRKQNSIIPGLCLIMERIKSQ